MGNLNEISDLTIFIDESGSITKTNLEHNKYFIIAFLITKRSQRLKRYFQKGIGRLINNNARYKDILLEQGEIKGSSVTETKKYAIYKRILDNCKDDFEIGVIVLDNNYTTEAFTKNHARAFNYVIQIFLDSYFRYKSKYKNQIQNINMIIDNQNIATKSKYTLDGYLNQHLTLVKPLCKHFNVIYVDSKNHALIQMIDFISNTFYRNIEKHDRTSIPNIKMLKSIMCGGRTFDFSENRSEKLFLEE